MLIDSEEKLNAYFFEVIKSLKPSYILDVGSRDCRTAIAMKESSKMSNVIAFEANPECYFDYCMMDRVKIAGIQVNHLAISDTVGHVLLKVPEYATREIGRNRGVASIKIRNDDGMRYRDYIVPSTTLDNFFQSEISKNINFAVWIDVEGALMEVLKGANKVLEKTNIIKAEVEGKNYWHDQSTDREIISYLEYLGFKLVAKSNKGSDQYDIIMINTKLINTLAIWSSLLK